MKFSLNKMRQVLTTSLFCLYLGIAPGASAVFFDINGEVTSCNAVACNLAGIGTGDLISGYLEVDNAAAQPNSTFTESDIISLQVSIGTLVNPPSMGPFGSTTITLDGDGEISSGGAQFNTMVDTGIGIADVEFELDASTGTWTATTTFFGFGEVASGTLAFARRVDTDNDSIADSLDNCTLIANTSQLDTNGDGYGNACDPDLDDNGVVNFIDVGLFANQFGSTGANAADFNGDLSVNFLDYAIVPSFIFGPPGPSALAP